MGWFDHHEESYNEYNNAPHQATLSHEVIAAAASFEAAKAYEDHVASNGQPDSHAMAKEIFAGLAGGIVDRMVETKGLDYIDKVRAKRQVSEHVDETFTEDVYQSYN